MKIENNVLISVENNDIDEKGHFIMPNGISSIEEFAFSDCNKLSKITIETAKQEKFDRIKSLLPQEIQDKVQISCKEKPKQKKINNTLSTNSTIITTRYGSEVITAELISLDTSKNFIECGDKLNAIFSYNKKLTCFGARAPLFVKDESGLKAYLFSHTVLLTKSRRGVTHYRVCEKIDTNKQGTQSISFISIYGMKRQSNSFKLIGIKSNKIKQFIKITSVKNSGNENESKAIAYNDNSKPLKISASGENVLITYPYIEGKDAEEIFLEKEYKFTTISFCKVMKDILIQLSRLHENNFIHCDIKLRNIMFELRDNYLETGFLIDMGLAINKDNMTKYARGTRRYTAPEVLSKSKNTCKGDIFSLGLVMLEILLLKDVTNNSNQYDTEFIDKSIVDAIHIPEKLKETLSFKQLVDIIKSMVEYFPKDRLQASEYISKLDKITSKDATNFASNNISSFFENKKIASKPIFSEEELNVRVENINQLNSIIAKLSIQQQQTYNQKIHEFLNSEHAKDTPSQCFIGFKVSTIAFLLQKENSEFYDELLMCKVDDELDDSEIEEIEYSIENPMEYDDIIPKDSFSHF